MDREAFEHHLTAPAGWQHEPAGAAVGIAGGAGCSDVARIAVTVEGDRVTGAGFDAGGCGATIAAGSAAVTLARDAPVLAAARLSAADIAAELGGLSPGKMHAAELAADALHRALGRATHQRGHDQTRARRVLVAMSSGVDSTVAALLCARAGLEVVAVTLELWASAENDAERSCCSASAVREARALAHRLGLPHLTLDLRDEFRRGVVEPFIADYAAGLTPNPCVRCNGHVRLDGMLELADRLGAAQLATGHYARLAETGDERGPLLRAAADPAKDQSYMLARLAPESLARMRFPLGELTKADVRALAAEAGLSVARKPDSQDLCFLAGTDRAAFLRRHGGVADRPGTIVDRAGRTLGRHRGQHHFTVGQRKGLGLAAGEPLYVLEKDAARNRVVAGGRADLETRTVGLEDAVLHRDAARVDAVKLRYRSRPVPARVTGHSGGTVELTLREAATGVAPGQLATLLDGDLIVGAGTIT